MAMVFQRKSDGRWVGRIQIEVDATTGKKKTKTVYGSTKDEVQRKVQGLPQVSELSKLRKRVMYLEKQIEELMMCSHVEITKEKIR